MVLADLGYEGENTRLTCPIKSTPGQELNVDQRTVTAPSPHCTPRHEP